MISYLPQEVIVMKWPSIAGALEKYWDVGTNFETLPNLKKRLLADDCRLWLWTEEEDGASLLFVSEDRHTAKARIFTVTHTAGCNDTGNPWTPRRLGAMIKKAFSEVELLAENLGFDAVCIHARPGHVRLADGYKKWNTPIIKMIKEHEHG